MNDFLLTYVAILTGLLATLGLIALVEWVTILKEKRKGSFTGDTPPPEYDPKDVAFKSTPTPDQIIEALKYIDENNNERCIERTQETNHD